MEQDNNQLLLKIITPNGTFFDGFCHVVTLKTTEGYIGIMKNHIPIAAAIAISELHINAPEDKNFSEAAIAGGLLYSNKNSVTIITDAIEYKDDIDLNRAQKTKERIQKLLNQKTSIKEHNKLELSLKKALNRIKIGSK